jgi:leucyl/phenylalanyl-tRNA---protein transferase
MAVIRFPDPTLSTPEGIVAFGGRMTPENLLTAYEKGIFPWPIEGLPLPWFCPPRRGVVPLGRVHISRSLQRAKRSSGFSYSIDRAFEEVVKNCASVTRPNESGTWINSEVVESYCELHRRRRAHSIEVWEGKRLVGGIYGVDAGGLFGGESMFHRKPNASKLGLLFLFEHLRSRGAEWMDIQVMSPHMAALGAVNISRARFLRLLSDTQRKGLKLFD